MAAARTPRRQRRASAGHSRGRSQTGAARSPSSDVRGSFVQQGFDEGYRIGLQTGIQRFDTPFEGTSIVIPTYNQVALVRQCIETIKWNTPEPYEIIVVDNASTDGTAAFLRSKCTEVRYRVLDRNYGFAGAINVGLMMAKGTTIVLLNNDTLVTHNWLGNMLRCLSSDERIGMVGPITNYISGSQLVKVPYETLSDMPEFARRNNRPDPARWRETDQLIGFCLLFRRELFEAVGYFDEGFEIGNWEDNDYSLRVRLLGRKLMIADDSFIHHIGSVSIKAVGDRMTKVNDQNERFYHRKWPNPMELISAIGSKGHSAGTASLYPERVIVRGIGANEYWIEQGQRRLVNGVVSLPVVRLPQVDLRRWPVGEPIAAEEAEHRWYGREPDDPSAIVRGADGAIYYRNGNIVRRLHGESALQSWRLDAKPELKLSSANLAALQEGLPIICPPVMKQSL